MKRVLLVPAAAVLLAASPNIASACGESMMRTGPGLRYQVYQAKVPAAVLVYASAARPEVVAGLESSGHRITVADDLGSLDQALLARRYDLVMADADNVDTVTERMQHHAVTAELVPVAESRGGIQRYAHSIGVDASIGQYLKLVNVIMKARS